MGKTGWATTACLHTCHTLHRRRRAGARLSLAWAAWRNDAAVSLWLSGQCLLSWKDIHAVLAAPQGRAITEDMTV